MKVVVVALFAALNIKTWDEYQAMRAKDRKFVKKLYNAIKEGAPHLWSSYKNEKSAQGAVRAIIQEITKRVSKSIGTQTPPCDDHSPVDRVEISKNNNETIVDRLQSQKEEKSKQLQYQKEHHIQEIQRIDAELARLSS